MAGAAEGAGGDRADPGLRVLGEVDELLAAGEGPLGGGEDALGVERALGQQPPHELGQARPLDPQDLRGQRRAGDVERGLQVGARRREVAAEAVGPGAQRERPGAVVAAVLGPVRRLQPGERLGRPLDADGRRRRLDEDADDEQLEEGAERQRRRPGAPARLLGQRLRGAALAAGEQTGGHRRLADRGRPAVGRRQVADRHERELGLGLAPGHREQPGAQRVRLGGDERRQPGAARLGEDELGPGDGVVGAAGVGERERHERAEVLGPVGGAGVVAEALQAAAQLDDRLVVAAVGHGEEEARERPHPRHRRRLGRRVQGAQPRGGLVEAPGRAQQRRPPGERVGAGALEQPEQLDPLVEPAEPVEALGRDAGGGGGRLRRQRGDGGAQERHRVLVAALGDGEAPAMSAARGSRASSGGSIVSQARTPCGEVRTSGVAAALIASSAGSGRPAASHASIASVTRPSRWSWSAAAARTSARRSAGTSVSQARRRWSRSSGW